MRRLSELDAAEELLGLGLRMLLAPEARRFCSEWFRDYVHRRKGRLMQHVCR